MIDDLSAIVAAYPHQTAHGAAWDCAWSLLINYPRRLTIQDHVTCLVALLAGPEKAGLGVIPLACVVIGARV
jgi:hypothetical protein